MKLSKYVVIAATLWGGITTASALLKPVLDDRDADASSLYYELEGAPSDESIGAFLKRSTDNADATGSSVRESDPGLHDMLLEASPLETVNSFVKRACPKTNCCAKGKKLARAHRDP